MKFKWSIWISFLLTGLLACRKNNARPDAPSGNRTQLTLDSIYLYAQQTYLWNEALPSFASFNPRKYEANAAERSALDREIFDLSQLKVNPLTGFAYELPLFAGVAKYSYLTDQSGRTSQSVAALSEPENNLGIGLAVSGSLIFISYVNPGSAAFKSGLERGDQVLEIDGMAATAGLAEKMTSAASAVLTCKKPDQSVRKVDLAKSVYENHGVFSVKLLQGSRNKVAYLALGQFNRLSVSKTELDQAFALFSSVQPAQLILDLRYNGGGFVESAEYLANLLAGSSLNGQVIYSEHFNDLLQRGQTGILKNQAYLNDQGQAVYLNGKRATMADVNFSVAANTHTFKKQGALESLKEIYFIVGPNTASASELLINSLKPYFQVKLTGSRTYGKPVGFFGINIDKYILYLSNFEIRNALGQGGYYSGFVPDAVVADDVSKNFGDPAEACLAMVLRQINGAVAAGNSSVPLSAAAPRLLGTDAAAKGMLKNHLNLKN
ncbi:S41 family peptidase [Pedobacter nutrimenti]|jgi:C-terminal processing protease CtpA/Prc|uniref:Peptidase S41-like protein n=1 Tax=Pedobacter nutrimenti TaxID=1241337 RepID=A0A318ULN4_9SPHI|nr:S41 family peptidase [Pedobacter nutrimenti]PYF77292.1 peptidase S41-like protein [Pedobacter nutrimenti]